MQLCRLGLFAGRMVYQRFLGYVDPEQPQTTRCGLVERFPGMLYAHVNRCTKSIPGMLTLGNRVQKSPFFVLFNPLESPFVWCSMQWI